MSIIGFSTGSLALGDFMRGLELVRSLGLKAVELSALREEELPPLVDAIGQLSLGSFDYVSVHAPSRLHALSESELVDTLLVFASRRWPIVVHPDVITDFAAWRRLGSCLCIENMDQRKSIGRTTAELAPFFESLPEAGFCLDLAHAAQIDPTMTEARRFLSAFSQRLLQVHVSSVDSESNHGPLTLSSRLAFRSVATARLMQVPWILESVVSQDCAEDEVTFARELESA